jgi:hypothetical protein
VGQLAFLPVEQASCLLLTDVADGLLVGHRLAADFEADVADGLVVGQRAFL